VGCGAFVGLTRNAIAIGIRALGRLNSAPFMRTLQGRNYLNSFVQESQELYPRRRAGDHLDGWRITGKPEAIHMDEKR
jgi:hypothetical protein